MINLAEHLGSRRLSWHAAAKKAGLSEERLREVAAGADASLRELRKIAGALRLPVASIVDETSAEPVELLFRQTLGQQKATELASIDIVSAQIRDVVALARDAGIPRNAGWLDLFRGMEPRFDSAERFASLFRKAYAELDDVEPFTNLCHVLAEQLGVFVVFGRDSGIEGVSAVVDGYAFIVIAARSFAPRTLFTLAHELGHLVAHHDNRKSDYAMLDLERDVGGLRAPRREEEKFADAVGSSLILPRQGVLFALKEFRAQLGASGQLGDIEILALARFFGVSFEVAAKRCESLGLLPPNGARALYQQLTALHRNPEKRADELRLPKREPIDLFVSPSLLAAGVKLVRQGQLSIGRVAEILNVPVSALFAANAGFVE